MMAVAAAQKNREMFAIKKSYSIENGYPARRRSLVDDARFEALVVKQTKQSALDEARQRSNDCPAAEDDDVAVEVVEQIPAQEEQEPAVQEIAAEEPQSPAFEELQSEPEPEPDTPEQLPDARQASDDAELTEEEMLLATAAAESAEAAQAVQHAALVLRLRDGVGALARILKTIENFKGSVTHVETRAAKGTGARADALVRVDISRQQLLLLLRALRQSAALASVALLADTHVSIKDPWFPRHASELDNCNHLMTKYEPELDMNHPGFADKVYRERRKMIADIAFAFKHGDPIPTIEYTAAETATWRVVFNNTVDLLPKYACAEYRRVFGMLEEANIFTPDRIPQLEEMSSFLNRHTGFRLRPAAGLLTARDFLASLAFRIFQSTQYVRHTSSPHHTPEPDCIHEMIGHMPLLADPKFAQFSQEIGLASLGASDAEIEKLSTAYGAGLLSSTRELLHAVSDKPEHRPFEPALTAIQPYQDQEVQPIYYVAESFEDAKDKFRRWVSTGMSRPFEVRFNPHTQRIEVLDSVERLESCVSQINLEVLHLNNALAKLRTSFA
ncbi:Tyrosine 3-monooxygenase [Gryllus bimaculatus]|nr:Tyrosine 3-monooxygenase [Gryllus bimaculatus]